MTLAVFVRHGRLHAVAIAGVSRHNFALFFARSWSIFLLAGMGNGSTYQMIPSIFAELGRREAHDRGVAAERTALDFKRQAAAVIGIAGAIGAFGGFLIQIAFRQASLPVVHEMVAAAKTIHVKTELVAATAKIAASHATWATPALWLFLAGYVLLGALTWLCYVREVPVHRRLARLTVRA